MSTLLDGMNYRRAVLDTQISATATERDALISELAALRATRRRCDDQLVTAVGTDRNRLASERHTCDRRAAEISTRETTLTIRLNQFNRERVELMQAITQSEYYAPSLEELQEIGRGFSTIVAACDAKLADLATERESLATKVQTANDSVAVVEAASDEVTAAQQALDNVRAESFISGVAVDHAAQQARLARAEKRLHSARESVGGASVALSRIQNRLSEIDDEVLATKAERGNAVRDWWLNRGRQADKVYMHHLDALLSAIAERIACDRNTGANVGMELKGAASNLKSPVRGMHIEGVSMVTHFGTSVTPDVSGATAKLDAEFSGGVDSERF